ncbi:MAG TPA: DUF4097 family beta strand repeat protein [Candidatus Scybalocola faecavium]|nr:DUF4097 family beta strand repeat protein [Candidatus Scybalocola faecavium]
MEKNNDPKENRTELMSHDPALAHGSAPRLKKIRFFGGDAHVCLLPSSDGNFYVYTKNEHQLEYVRHFSTPDAYEGSVEESKGIFRRGHGPVDTVILEIPDSIDELQIETTGGNIYGREIHCTMLTLTTASGNCHIEKIYTQGTFINTQKGNLSLERLHTTLCQIRSVSGEISSRDGSMKKLMLQSRDGSVSFSRLTISDGQIQTDKGNITISLARGQRDFCAFAHSDEGQVRVQDGPRLDPYGFQMADETKYIKLMATSDQGDISICAAAVDKRG